MNRRTFFQSSAVIAAAIATSRDAIAAPAPSPAATANGYTPVITPNGTTLPWRTRGALKIGHLIAMPDIDHEFAPGLRARCWGYNGGTPGPTIEAVEGDRVRIYVTNRLPEPTTVHWHGVLVPNGMDGVAGLTQKSIAPGETFKYEFTFNRAGTFMYHPHYDEMTQMALGMMGMIVVHPKHAPAARVDRDFVLMTHEWRIQPGAHRPDPLAMDDFNVLTFNAKAYPATAPLIVGHRERVRIRFGNLSAMDHHPIHLHGHAFSVTQTDGGDVPKSAQFPETTTLVAVGTTRTIELIAHQLGDWPMHCHMTHHTMNQMGHRAVSTVGADAARLDRALDGMPGFMTMGQNGYGGMDEMPMPMPDNSIPMRGAVGPFGRIEMGGMFTILKVRSDPSRVGEMEWYEHEAGSVAVAATSADLFADGITLDK